MPAALGPGDYAYRGAFYLGTGLIFLSLALGVATPLRREGRLPRLTQDPLDAANGARLRGDVAKVRREYRSAVNVNGGQFDFLLRSADALARAGDFEAAADAVTRAQALQPSSPRLHRARGLIFLWQRRFAESQAAFEQALRGDPSDGMAYAGLGDLWLEQDRFAEAEGAFLHALRLEPWSADVHNSLGITYALSGRPAKAVESFENALRVESNPSVQANLARAQAALEATRARKGSVP
jgi:Flp pilus assembly protein TadD